MASAATAGAEVTGSCFTLSSDAQGQGWPPTSPARTGSGIVASAPCGNVTQAPWRRSDGAPQHRGMSPGDTVASSYAPARRGYPQIAWTRLWNTLSRQTGKPLPLQGQSGQAAFS